MSPSSIMRLNGYWGAYYAVACTTMFFTRWNFAQAAAAVITQEVSRLIWQGCPIALYATSRVDRGGYSKLYVCLGKRADKVLIAQPIATFIILLGGVGYFVPEPPSDVKTTLIVGAGFIGAGFALTRYRIKRRVIQYRQTANL